MKSGLINKTSPFVDIVDMLSGSWNEYDEGEFHVVVTPFFTVLSATLDAGSHVFPFKVSVPVAAVVSHADKTVDSCIIRPGDTAVKLDKAGIFNLQLFGEHARMRA